MAIYGMAASQERFEQYELVGVQTTERILGRGSYGWVMEVRAICYCHRALPNS